MATNNTKQPRLTLHYLLGATSFWGTSVRLLLMAFLGAAVFTARVIVMPETYASEVQAFIYIVGSFALLDAGYVMLARAMPLKRSLDMTVLLLADAAIAIIYVVPNFVYIPGFVLLGRWTVLIVIFVLSIRALLGLLLANTKKR